MTDTKTTGSKMNNPKLRKTLITLHLLFAGFFTPMFLMLAITGGNYLLGNKGSAETTPIALPAAAMLDFKSSTLQADVEALLTANDIDHKFEYIKNRGSKIQLRPTSRKYIEIAQTSSGLSASYKTPNLQGRMMELHKGHGPKIFKTYQKLTALALIGVVLGGFFVGILAAAYRRRTLIATGLGALIFVLLMNA
ncbi:MAG: hypothetical protein ACPGVT_12925 [Maricaulaceae bacterium]